MRVAGLVPPDVRARLKTLRLSARHAGHGQGIGQHASRSRGAGLEFAQFRAYEPGDEPRLIDWKLYGRSDRYFVRDSTRDSPLTAWLLIDATASMAQADGARPEYTKLDAAKAIAVCVAELALRQSDSFGLITGGANVGGLPAGAGQRHRDRLWLELDRLTCDEAAVDEAALRPLVARVAPASLLIVLTDGYDDALVETAIRVAAARREVIFISLVGRDELEFPFVGDVVFRDPETGAIRRGRAETMRAAFVERYARARAALARRLEASGIRCVEHVIDEPADAPLRRLFGSSVSVT